MVRISDAPNVNSNSNSNSNSNYKSDEKQDSSKSSSVKPEIKQEINSNFGHCVRLPIWVGGTTAQDVSIGGKKHFQIIMASNVNVLYVIPYDLPIVKGVHIIEYKISKLSFVTHRDRNFVTTRNNNKSRMGTRANIKKSNE